MDGSFTPVHFTKMSFKESTCSAWATFQMGEKKEPLLVASGVEAGRLWARLGGRLVTIHCFAPVIIFYVQMHYLIKIHNI